MIVTTTFTEPCSKDDPATDSPIKVTDDAPVFDYDGNTYKTVINGDQIWLVKNLRATQYPNVDPITKVTQNLKWAGLCTGAYCAYNVVT